MKPTSLMSKNDAVSSFWDHLEELRLMLFRILGFVLILVFVAFFYIEYIFNTLILAPLNSDFILYVWISNVMDFLHLPWGGFEPFSLKLINFQIAGQFMAHLSSSMLVASILSIPFILYQLWLFISPALHIQERKHTALLFFSSSFLFYLGTIVSYFILIPLSVRFLGTYEVSALIPNQISLESYLGVFFILILIIGLMFELPVVIYFLSKMGLVTKRDLKKARKYALIAVLIISALITPTTDPFTMLLVTLPLYLLYEAGILVSRD